MCGAWQPQGTPHPCLDSRRPAGEGAEVAGRGCGGLRQEKTLQKNCPSQQVIHVYCSKILRLKIIL